MKNQHLQQTQPNQLNFFVPRDISIKCVQFQMRCAFFLHALSNFLLCHEHLAFTVRTIIMQTSYTQGALLQEVSTLGNSSLLCD